jgi:hypothetical protein
MNKNSVIAVLIAFSLASAISVNIVYAQQVFPSPTVQLRKTASGITIATPSSSSAATPPSASKPQHIAKIKITSPAKGQQVPVGKDLTISGTSYIDNATANTNDCKVSVSVNKVRPYQPATATGTGVKAADDYSKWNFVLASKYTTIKPGQNRITAKYECINNPALTSFSSVNVTGVPAAATAATTAPVQITTKTAATVSANAAPKSSSPISLHQTTTSTAATAKTTTTSAAAKQQEQQHPITTNNNNPASASNGAGGTAVAAPVSSVSNKSLSATTAPQVKIAPQQDAMSQQQQHQPATDNWNQNFLTSSTSKESNVRPLSKVTLPETQRNESSSFTSASQLPTENTSSTGLLSVFIKVGKDPVTAGNKQNVIVSVSDARSNEKVAGAKVIGLVMKPSGVRSKEFEINTDNNGQASYSWKIRQSAGTPGIYKVAVTVLALGYQQKVATTSFTVKPSALLSISSITSLDRNNDINSNNNLLANHIDDFTNEILGDVKQSLKNKWTPRHFILALPL